MIFALIQQLFAICLFQKGPQHLPKASVVLAVLLISNAAVNFLMLNMNGGGWASGLQTLTALLLDVLFISVCLLGAGKLPRLTQTLSALLGVDAIISFLALPAMATLVLGQGGIVVFLLMVILIVWHWAVIGHILRHALDQRLSFSLGLALLYLLTAYQIMALLFPEVPAAH